MNGELGSQQPRQFVDDGDLAAMQLAAGRFQRKPGGAVDLRERGGHSMMKSLLTD